MYPPRFRVPYRLLRLREHARETLWVTPVAGLVLACLLWRLALTADQELVTVLASTGIGVRDFTEDVKTIVTVISQAMLTFLGVVFSVSLVALQMTSGQLTPRVVRIFVRSRITKLTLTVFLSTFVFSLLVLTSYNGGPDPDKAVPVPLIQSAFTLLLVGLSLLLFIAYVTTTLRLMQVGPVVDHIARESLRVVERATTDSAGVPDLPAVVGLVRYEGRAGVLRDVDVARLVRCARRQGAVLRLLPRIGDYVMAGTALLEVYGGQGLPPAASAASAVSLGPDRTSRQDLGFGLRQLADIALRALSPAVNDPTTAVQCLDRIVHLLGALGQHPLGPVLHRDRHAHVRLVQTGPDWENVVDLGLGEIRVAAVAHAQVTRRMFAGIDDLLEVVPHHRAEPLLRHRTLLELAVNQTLTHPADRAFALQPDRQGIG
ncbi:DUF2254 domain-containing protein [Streptomyces subrutilus]|uniref:DUF2254 domain-containing protein n=1 Tax=Streptomyces subrutilus TaxID=36818 RepID=UPI0033D69CE4